jgi:hypothetical protein|tara:strand:- start:4 stop:207 length:204 start_codon:yes stop_codon:yes gene_type:complete
MKEVKTLPEKVIKLKNAQIVQMQAILTVIVEYHEKDIPLGVIIPVKVQEVLRDIKNIDKQIKELLDD